MAQADGQSLTYIYFHWYIRWIWLLIICMHV
jgi:hypothetical protein